MELWHGALLTAVGVLAGFLNVMAGGGSLLTVPAMLFLGVPGPVANGTNRIAILFQNITAVATFFRKGYSDFALSFSLALAALPGAILGAFIGTRFGGEWFERLIALVMIAVMVLMALEERGKNDAKPQERPSSPSKSRLIWGHALMVGAGFWGGFIQIGIGFILMPILHRVMGLDLVRVNMHKVFIILVYTIAALSIFIWQVELIWLYGIALAVGNSIGGWLGARVTIEQGDKWIKRVFNAVLVVLIVRLLFF